MGVFGRLAITNRFRPQTIDIELADGTVETVTNPQLMPSAVIVTNDGEVFHVTRPEDEFFGHTIADLLKLPDGDYWFPMRD